MTSCDSTSGECDECIVEKADGTKSNSGYWRYTRCNAGYSYKSGECPPTEVDTSKYPFTQGELNEEIGEVECVQSAQNVYCGYKSCNEGWDINSGNCIVHDCGSAYPYTSCDTNGTCGECKSGEHTKYSAPTCNLGWYTSGGNCVENDCSAFSSATSSITGCSSSSSCLSGVKTTYKCDNCYTGYEVENGVCNKTCTYTTTSKPNNCAIATGSCQLGSASGTTTYYATTCQTCNNGYEVSSGSCIAAACTGYDSTSTSITGCQTVSSACLSGTTNKYKCNTCYTGYSLTSGKCNKTCTYTKTSKPSNCKTVSSCQLGSASGTTTYYSSSCTTCNTGYTVSNGSCVVSCSYTRTTKPSNCSSAASCSKNGTTYYSSTCSQCNSGYSLSGGSCVASAQDSCLSGLKSKYKCVALVAGSNSSFAETCTMANGKLIGGYNAGGIGNSCDPLDDLL